MTPKEEAKELVDKYLNASFNCKDCDMPFCDVPCTMLSITEAKECALIAVDEIALKINGHHKDAELTTFIEYWQEVKKEIKTYRGNK